MKREIENEIEKEQILNKVCQFFRLKKPHIKSHSIVDAIKEVCVLRLCQAIGLTGLINHKSDFFDFFSSMMGEAICEKLDIKLQIACDQLRLVKYEHINLVQECKRYLDGETVEEAFLDAFELAEKFKSIIPELKKTS